MTSRELEIFEIIKRNPMVSQNEIAETLGIARASVAVHIANLMKKGAIKGKGYVVDENEYVICVGAANVDIQGFSKNPLIMRDSNPGRMKLTAGGVSRNIGENLARMGIQVKMVTAIGNDIYGDLIRSDCTAAGMDISHIQVVNGKRSSTYLSIIDADGDMYIALSDMHILKELSLDYIKSKHHELSNARMIVTDPSLSFEAMEYLVRNYSHIPIVVDTVSTSYAKVIKELLGNFHTVKPNIYEAEILADMKIGSEGDLDKAADKILSTGVKRLFVTLGKDGIYYKDSDGARLIRKTKQVEAMVNATGAGDACTAGIVYSTLHGFGIEETLDFSMTSAILALCHENTINPNISAKLVQESIKEWKL